MKLFVSVEGRLVEEDRAVVSIMDRGYLYGDGVFDTLACYGGKIFRFNDHMERLEDNACGLGISMPFPQAKIKQLILKALRKNRLKEAYIRVSLSRGKAGLGPEPREGLEPSLCIIIRPLRVYPLLFYRRGVEVITAATRRLSPQALDGRIKSMNYLNSILARESASRSKCFEAVMLSEEGYVTEGSAGNIFMVKGGKLITPPGYLGVLEGITRKVVLELAQKLSIEVKMVPFTAYDLYNAAECFLTGTIINIMPVRGADKRVIGSGSPGKVTLLLKKKLDQLKRM